MLFRSPGSGHALRLSVGHATFICAHGAGSHQRHASITAIAHGLAALGIDVVTFNFPYTEAGRKLPDRAPALEAWRADLSGVHAASHDPELLRAAAAMNDGRLDEAESSLDARLRRLPEDPPALRLLGEVRWRRGEMTEALALVERAVVAAPGFDLARDFLARLLLQTNRLPEALEHAEVLARSPVTNRGHELLMASVLVRLGRQDEAGEIYGRLQIGRAHV